MPSIQAGATSVTRYYVLRDATSRAPKTDIDVTTIDLYSLAQGAAMAAKVDCTALASADAAYASGGAYNCGLGLYRIDWPNVFGGNPGTTVQLAVVCSGVDTTFEEIELSPPVNVSHWKGATAPAMSGDAFARLGAPVGASIAEDIASRAPSATALSTANWTNGRAALLDNLDDTVSSRSTYDGSDTPGTVTLLGRLTAPRAGYLDKLNVTGNVASSAEVTAIQNNTRVRVIVPPVMERPDAGSTAFLLHLYCYDEAGNMEAPDSTPTVTAANHAGTDRSANLGAVANPGTGHYTVTYTLSSGDAVEQLLFEWTVTEGGVARQHGAAAQVVDTTAVDFTSADRTTLQAVESAVGALNDLSSAEAQAAAAAALNTYDPPTHAEVTALVDAIKGAGWTTETLVAIQAAVNSRLAASGYTAPDNAGIAAAKAVTDKLDTAVELDGAVYRFTQNALEQGPVGAGSDPQAIAAALLDGLLAGHNAAGSVGRALLDILAVSLTIGTGPKTQPYTVRNAATQLPEPGVRCEFATDEPGLNVVGTSLSNAAGVAYLRHDLPSGTPVYIRRYKAGVDFLDDPDVEVIP
jgi:hypothetical protein